MSSGFKAARDTAYNLSWTVLPEYTADKELSDSNTLKTLRQRSRQLIKDNLIAAGIQQTYINTVGALNTIKAVSKSRIQETQAQKIIDSFSVDATIDNKSMSKVIEEIIAASFQDGDLLISLPLDNKRKNIKTVVELIEASRIKTPINLKRIDTIRHGVKYDNEGRILGYYVKKYDKMDSYSDNENFFDFYPRVRDFGGVKRVVTQLFKAPLNSRPQMSRQYPIITPVITMLKHLDDYLEAVVVGARVAACFAGFVKSMNPAGAYNAFTKDENGNIEDPLDSNNTARRVHKLFPGMIHYLKPNESIDFASPNRPNDNVDAFIVRICKLIAMYLRIPYPVLFLDLSEVNYSSFRGGANEMKKTINRWRKDLDNIIDWIINTVLLEASLRGTLRGNINTISLKKRWPVHGILDSEKEARSNKIELQNGTTSPQRICDEEGTVYEEIQKELEEDQIKATERTATVLKRQQELEKDLGILFQPDTEPKQRERELREGEGDVLDDEEKKERRKQDGNW